MIGVDEVAAPDGWDLVKSRGLQWLSTHPKPKRPTDLWSPFKPHLAEGFAKLCGYSAMFEPVGTVDHFLSCDERRELAYEWSNYRFAAGWINSAKNAAPDGTILDPYQVGIDWFEIVLDSLELIIGRGMPSQNLATAKETMRRLHLANDRRLVHQRREWYRMFTEGELTLIGLEKKAPLIARAIQRRKGLIP